jgi:hypothetical protein
MKGRVSVTTRPMWVQYVKLCLVLREKHASNKAVRKRRTDQEGSRPDKLVHCPILLPPPHVAPHPAKRNIGPCTANGHWCCDLQLYLPEADSGRGRVSDGAMLSPPPPPLIWLLLQALGRSYHRHWCCQRCCRRARCRDQRSHDGGDGRPLRAAPSPGGKRPAARRALADHDEITTRSRRDHGEITARS